MKALTFKSPLPDNILKMLDHAERKRLGKDFRTMDEINQDNEHRTERELHNQIENLLRLKNIVFFHSRTDRKTTRPKGEPDFLFAVILDKPGKHDPTGSTCVPVPVAWEVKIGKAKLRPEQEALLQKMQRRPNGWYVKVIRSLQEAADDLKSLGV